MNDGGNHDFIVLHSIDDSIAVCMQFTDGLVIEFGNFAAGSRKACEGPGEMDDILNNDAGIGWRVGGYVVGDGCEVMESPL